MADGKTSTGFKFKANAKRLKDVRFLMAYKKMVKSDDGTELLEMIPMVLGDEQTEALIGHCEKDGISTIEDVAAEFGEIVEILAKADETKN